ncbi:hypothetical protein ACFQY7_41270 [Actinomadura luteofluorescens]
MGEAFFSRKGRNTRVPALDFKASRSTSKGQSRAVPSKEADMTVWLSGVQ